MEDMRIVRLKLIELGSGEFPVAELLNNMPKYMHTDKVYYKDLVATSLLCSSENLEDIDSEGLEGVISILGELYEAGEQYGDIYKADVVYTDKHTSELEDLYEASVGDFLIDLSDFLYLKFDTIQAYPHISFIYVDHPDIMFVLYMD